MQPAQNSCSTQVQRVDQRAVEGYLRAEKGSFIFTIQSSQLPKCQTYTFNDTKTPKPADLEHQFEQKPGLLRQITIFESLKRSDDDLSANICLTLKFL